MTNKYEPPNEVIETGEEEGLFRVKDNKIEYIAQQKSYKISNPEEGVRAAFYLELIKKYQYPKERIDFEVSVKGEKRPAADVVVFEDGERKKPYIVIECKKDGISQAEIKQAIEEGIPNAHYLKAKYAIVVAGNVRIAFDIAKFPPQEREKNVIADIPVRYGKVVKYVYKKGGPKDKDDPSKELKDVNRDELLKKFQQCHDALWEGGKRNPAEAFDEMSKLMYCKIQDERFLTKKGEYYRFQVGTYERINEVAERIRKIYKDAQKIDKEVFLEPIKTDNSIVYTVAEILQGISLARTDLDVKGEGYEHFLGGVFRGAMGQYFTPRPIVSFMVNFLEPSINDIIIDPACGSGGFLIYPLERVRRELYQKLDDRDAFDRWKDFALKQVYGIEINSQLARVSMMNMIIHEDGHTNIENADALDNPETWKRQKIREYFGKEFTLLLTNPPFGASIKEKQKPYLVNYELGGKIKKRNRQNTEILFIERCLDFLKPGGRMGIVLPDGILTNSSLQYVRDFMTERAQILGVVSLPQTAFRKPSSKGGGATGSGVKASLLFLRKKKERETLPENYPIFMAIAEHIGYDATGRKDKDEFPDILKAWQEFRETNKIDFFAKAPLCFAIGRGEVEGRVDTHYYKPEYSIAEKGLKDSKWGIVRFGELLSFVANGVEIRRYVEEGTPYLRVSEMKEDGIDLSNVKFVNASLTKLVDKIQLEENDILISRSGSLGLVALVDEKIKKCIISSHIIRVVLDKEKVNEINPKYIVDFLRTKYGLLQFFRKKIGAVVPEIDHEALKSIIIPIPPRQIQDKIADMMDEAYRIKKEKEAEAEKLLNSIDDYVLNELGIKLPQIKEQKNFSITFDKIKRKRFDPYSHQPKFRWADQALSKIRYKVALLKDIVEKLDYGLMPTQDYAKDSSEGLPMIRVTNMTPDGYIVMSDTKYIKFDTPRLKEKLVTQDDLLMVQCGNTTGKVAFVTKEFEGYTFGSFIFVIRGKKDIVNPYYLYILFSNPIIQQQVWKEINISTVRPNTSKPVVENLKVPIPPLSVQQKIATEVKSRRARAKKLKEEAIEALATAKEKVEKVIFPEVSEHLF